MASLAPRLVTSAAFIAMVTVMKADGLYATEEHSTQRYEVRAEALPACFSMGETLTNRVRNKDPTQLAVFFQRLII